MLGCGVDSQPAVQGTGAGCVQAQIRRLAMCVGMRTHACVRGRTRVVAAAAVLPGRLGGHLNPGVAVKVIPLCLRQCGVGAHRVLRVRRILIALVGVAIADGAPRLGEQRYLVGGLRAAGVTLRCRDGCRRPWR